MLLNFHILFIKYLLFFVNECNIWYQKSPSIYVLERLLRTVGIIVHTELTLGHPLYVCMCVYGW